MTIDDRIEKLSLSEKKVLLVYAFMGDNIYYATNLANDIGKTIGFIGKEFTNTTKKLNDKGFLYSLNYYYSEIRIYPTYRIPMLVYGIKYLDKFVNEIYNTNVYGSYRLADSRRFADIIKYCVTGKSKPNGTINEYEISTLSDEYLSTEWGIRLLGFLNEESYLRYVARQFEVHLLTDNPLDDNTISVLCDVSERTKWLKCNLTDIKYLHKYYTTGEFVIDKPDPSRPYQQQLLAIRAANKGDYEQAIKNFNYSFKTINKLYAIKNVPLSFLPAYYYVMSLVHIGTEKATTKLDQFIKKKGTESFVALEPAKLLAEIFISHTHDVPQYLLKNVLSADFDGHVATNIRNIGTLISNTFADTTYALVPTLSKYAIVNFEVAKYLQISDEEKAKLNALYGGNPIVSSMRVKQNWEWTIEDILKTIEADAKQTKAAKAEEKVERLVYVINNAYSPIEAMYQYKLKNGDWSTPRKAPVKKFETCELPYMDDLDRKISRMVSHIYGYSYGTMPTLAQTASLMIGCDRLYYYNKKTGIHEPVEVIEERPFVKLNKDKFNITISTNVPKVDESTINSGSYTKQIDNTHYVVINVSGRQCEVLNRLLALGKFPLDAEQQVRSFLIKLEDIIDVESPLIDKKAIPQINGQSHIVAAVTPASAGKYDIALSALPAPNGTTKCVPGEGKTIVFDTVDGAMVRVKRDLKGEVASLHAIIDLLQVQFEDLSYDDYEFTLDIDGVLTLLEYAKTAADNLSIEWAKGKGITLKSSPSASSWNVGLKSNHGWFDIEGEVRVDDNTVLTMSQMLELVAASRGRYIKLNDTDYIEIDKKLRKQLERLESMAYKNRNRLQISPYSAAMLDDSVLDGEIKVAFDKKLSDLLAKVKDSESFSPKVPKTLNAQLRPYQIEGFQWMSRLAQWGAGACLADDMGLGKTVQTIAFLLTKASEGPALVVAPASVVHNWELEIAKFAPTLSPVILNKAPDRAGVIKDAKKYDVVLTTYGLLSTEGELLSEKKWTTICLDEAHTIKNKETKMSQAAMSLQSEYRIILTGTPIQNHLGELWNLFRFINPGLLGSSDTFRHKFVNPIVNDDDQVRKRALQRMIKPFLLRRTKAEVIDDLPDKTEINIPIELTNDEMAMYEALRLKAVEALEKAEKLDVNTLAEITKLRRAACSIKLVDSVWQGAESKVQGFMDLVSDFKGDNNRMLVFSQFTSFLELIRKALDDAGEPYLYLDGSTPINKRQKLVEEFREGKCALFLISLKAGGLGLNLPEANYVVHLDPWWNPAIEQQATDRAYRIGQKRNVTVYHLVAKNTIEEKILRLHRTKRDLADSLLEGTNMAGQMTVKDMLELINQE